MSDLYYTVRLGRSALLSENFLVQLICEEHQGLAFYESNREAAACKIAVDALTSRYGSESIAAIGYKEGVDILSIFQ
jgi:hypothetical protein